MKEKLQYLFLVIIIGLFGVAPTLLQAQNLTEYAPNDSLRVGDTFNFVITLERNQEYDDIIFPDSAEFGTTFEIRARDQYKVSAYKDSIAYELQFFGTADTTLPQMPVYLVQDQDTTTLYTNPVPVRFSSTLAEGEDSFRPLKPIFDFAAVWWPYLLALIILAFAGYYLYQYYLQKQKEKEKAKERPEFSPEPFVNPIKEFRKAIRELENAKLENQEDFKAFYIDLGDAIRQFYESLYNLPALESTSHELLTMLKNGAVDEDLIADTRAVLQEADKVKFAKFKPTEKQADRALSKAYNFLERAREIDGPRIEHLRRKHQSKVEEKRQQFYKKHDLTNQEEEVTA